MLKDVSNANSAENANSSESSGSEEPAKPLRQPLSPEARAEALLRLAELKVEIQKEYDLLSSLQEANAAEDGSWDLNSFLPLQRKIRKMNMEIAAARKDAYFVFELPEPIALEGLDILAIRELILNLREQDSVLFMSDEDRSEEDQEKIKLRRSALGAQITEANVRLNELKELAYAPGPDDAPAYEPDGYESTPGYVKLRPENNEHYLSQMKENPWYPAILSTHEQLERLIPGYNISQIKDKFGGLRYYFSYPATIPVREDWPAYNTVEKIQAMADRIVARAEAWVDGYEYAQRELKEAQELDQAQEPKDVQDA